MSGESVAVREKVLSANDRAAADVRRALVNRGTFALNLISSPGSGKTLLLERTVDALRDRVAIAVLAGDVQTRNDAERLERQGVQVQAIETGGGCHLNAQQVAECLPSLLEADPDLMLIENVGNLVCPSSFDLGEAMKVVLMSVTEGEDKPLKYPAAFSRAGALVVTKMDLLPHLKYSIDRALDNARRINPDLEVFCTSSIDGFGLDAWTGWLETRVRSRRSDLARAVS